MCGNVIVGDLSLWIACVCMMPLCVFVHLWYMGIHFKCEFDVLSPYLCVLQAFLVLLSCTNYGGFWGNWWDRENVVIEKVASEPKWQYIERWQIKCVYVASSQTLRNLVHRCVVFIQHRMHMLGSGMLFTVECIIRTSSSRVIWWSSCITNHGKRIHP